MDAVIIAGGKGSRMEDPLPKALVEANGEPIIVHQIMYLMNQVDKIILALGYKGQDVIDHIKKNYGALSTIDYVLEQEPLGTGGALKLALQKATSEFVIVLNCDDITNIKLSDLEKNCDNTVCVANPKLPFGLVNTNNGYAEFKEKPVLTDRWTSCGWYLLNRKELLEKLPDKGSLEYDVFQTGLVKLRTYEHTGFWSALNTKKDIDEFERILKEKRENKTHE